MVFGMRLRRYHNGFGVKSDLFLLDVLVSPVLCSGSESKTRLPSEETSTKRITREYEYSTVIVCKELAFPEISEPGSIGTADGTASAELERKITSMESKSEQEMTILGR